MTMTPRSEWPAALQARPVCPKRGLPAPYIAEVDEATGEVRFTVLDTKAAIRCMENRLCAMCSDPMGAEVALIGDRVSLDPEGYFIEPPVHERCAELAVGGLCPFLSRERVPRRPVAEGLNPVGISPAELGQVGRPGKPKRPVIVAICEDYDVGLVQGTDGEVIAYRARGVLRVRRYRYQADRLTEIATEHQQPGRVAVFRSQPKRRSRAARRR